MVTLIVWTIIDPYIYYPSYIKYWKFFFAEQLSFYLESNNLLAKSQHGFRPKLSTETAFSTDKLYENTDNKKVSLLTLCELSKEFDTVNKKILLNKCSLLNIDSFWFYNYLNNRNMSLRLVNNISKKNIVYYGVPQG